VVSDSPDDASPAGRSGKENQAEPVEQTNQAEPNETSGRDGGKSVAGRVGQPCRYSTEEEHLVAFLENGREGEKEKDIKWNYGPAIRYKHQNSFFLSINANTKARKILFCIVLLCFKASSADFKTSVQLIANLLRR